MPRSRSNLERAAGKLISAIQKAWHAEDEWTDMKRSEGVMHTSHELLQAASAGTLHTLLHGRTVAEFLDSEWVNSHPKVWPHVVVLQSLVQEGE